MWPFKKNTKLDKANKQIKRLEKELESAKQKEAERERVILTGKKKLIVQHLKAAERYENMIGQVKGARKSEYQALIDSRLESVKNLGFDVKDSISETINNLNNGY